MHIRSFLLSCLAVAGLGIALLSSPALAYDGPVLSDDNVTVIYDAPAFDSFMVLDEPAPINDSRVLVAVDSSISAYCTDAYAGSAYQRPGGFCDAVADNKSLLDSKSSRCPDGGQWNGYECVCVKELS